MTTRKPFVDGLISNLWDVQIFGDDTGSLVRPRVNRANYGTDGIIWILCYTRDVNEFIDNNASRIGTVDERVVRDSNTARLVFL